MSQVFLSYSKKELAQAKRFKRKLEEAGFTIWMDTSLRAGTEWRDMIDREIRRSVAVVVVMTSAARRSEYVMYECAFAYGTRVRVIQAIYVEPKSLHVRFDVLQYRDFRKAPFPWDELIADIRDAESSSSSRLHIHHAAWGVMSDVTQVLQNQQSNDGITLSAKKDLLGNPHSLRGLEKELCVFYSKGGESKVRKVPEHQSLQI